jgi:hypothetical protein
MATRLSDPRIQVEGADGRPLAGAKLYTYDTGTSTPKPTYTDAALSVPHANPIIADAAGRFPAIFLTTGTYKTELRDANEVVIATDDPVDGAPEVVALGTLDNVEPAVFNSRFTIWQRGTSIAIPANSSAVTAIYGPDGWAMETGPLQACTISRQTGMTPDAQFCARFQRDSGQTGTAALTPQQWLETHILSQFIGRQVTLSADIRVGSNFSGTLQMYVAVGTGTEGRRPRAGSFTSESAVTPLGVLSVTTSAQRIVQSGAVTIPAGTTQGAVLFRWVPSGTAGANDFFEVGRVVLAPSPGMDPPMTTDMYDLQRAQRWYALPRSHFRGRNETGATPAFTVPMYFPVTMRAVPGVTAGTVVSTAGFSARAAAQITASSCSVDLTANAGPVNLTDVTDWVADARL